MKLRKRQGSAYLLVVVVFVCISVFTTLLVTVLNRSIFHMHTYAMQMQAYYLNHEAQEAVVAILLDDDRDLLQNMEYPQTDSMTHTFESETLGESEITVSEEVHPYYGTDAAWIVARVVTTIPDKRSGREGESFSYSGTAMLLKENPIVQLYNISPDSLDDLEYG